MPNGHVTEDDLAQSLARHLTNQVGYGMDRISPIETAVRKHMQVMADELAAQAVSQSTTIRDVVDRHVKDAIGAALRDDDFLRGMVTKAVAKTLAGRHSYSDDGSDG